ncbi:MAG: zinc-dependent metalloprotease [Fimbriimonadales bacterium]|nr:zinc-dependent metalloprotease [Fimbriimonadales bacterium]
MKRITLLLSLLSLSVAWSVSGEAESQLPTLFEHVSVKVPADAPALRFAVAYQPVRVRWEVVLQLAPNQRIRLNLMQGTTPIGIVERIERRSENRFSAFGRIEGIAGTHFILVREDDALALFVSVPPYDATFDLRYLKDDVYVVVRVGEELPCGTDDKLQPTEGEFPLHPEDALWLERYSGSDFEPAGDFEPASCVRPNPVLDVAVYYTEQARAAIGGVSFMNARIQLFMDQTNLSYQNSQINLRARLVRRLEVNYPDEGGASGRTQLNQLTNSSDGVIDEIHTDRNNYRADQVVLLVFDTDVCGIAWCGNGNDPQWAFNVTQVNCTNYTFAHEIGHNQGCGHDRANGSCGFRSYAFGWRFFGSDGNQYRTVMAYAPGTRVPHFSNPNVLYLGAPTGVPIGQPDEAHNAFVINETSHSRETFRLLDVWVDFGYSGTETGAFATPFNTVAEGVSAITTAIDTSLVTFPMVRIKAGARREPIVINKRVRLEACGGTVRITAQ